MKIKRFVAKDMRTALTQIKEELGADAVIMSNKKIPEGVELMAAVDYQQKPSANKAAEPLASSEPNNADMQSKSSRAIDNDVVSLTSDATQPTATNNQTNPPADSLSALLNRHVQQGNKPSVAVPTSTASQTTNPTTAKNLDIEQQFKNFTDRLEQASPELEAQNQHTGTQAESLQQAQVATSAPQTAHSSPELEQMRAEMLSIRQLLEHQVSGLMWQDMAQKDPNRAVLVNRLMALGLTEDIADQIAGYVSNTANEEQAWQEAKELIAQQLNTTNNEIIHRGGVVSLVGPTGVGKTTTIAKLAGRFAQIHGADQVVMISTDSYRIAGFEQLSTFARIIGCQVALANDAPALDTLLSQYADKKLVLIDTAGMGQRDMRLAEHLTTLIANSRVRIRNYLVLAANTQQRVMQENVERFKKIPIAGCIYTKLDESLSVGEIIATSIQNGLPIGYLTDGQRVPEDIKVANAEKLVTLADKLATKTNGHQFARVKPQPRAVMV